MNIVFLVAAERGLRCLKSAFMHLGDSDTVTVFTFLETKWEPKYVDKIKFLSDQYQARSFVTSKVHDQNYKSYVGENADIIFVIGWRYMIPKSVYQKAKIGCFVFHDSYLPKYRGFGPTVWAMRNGESYTGTTLFKISEKVDEGPILFQEKVEIANDDYIGDVIEKITAINEKLIVSALNILQSNNFQLLEQDHRQATYTCKNIPSDFLIDWNLTAKDILFLIKSYSRPYPGAYTYFKKSKVIIYRARIDCKDYKYIGYIPGRVKSINTDGTVSIFCGDGQVLRLEEVEYKETDYAPSYFIKSVGDTLGE